MGWLCLILGGTVLAAGNSIVDKKILHGQAVQPFACATSFGIVGLPVALLGLLIFPAPSRSQALLGIAAGVLFIPAAWLYYDTLAREDVSRIVPLLRLSSLQTLLLGMFFLGEMLTAKQWIAFFFLLGSSFLLSCKPGIRGMACSWTALRVLPATTLLALSGILMAGLYRTTSVWTGITWESVGMVLCITVLSLLRRRGTRCWWKSASLKDWGGIDWGPNDQAHRASNHGPGHRARRSGGPQFYAEQRKSSLGLVACLFPPARKSGKR